MKKRFLFLIVTALFSVILFGQTKSLKIIEADIDFTPLLYEDVKYELQKIDEIIEKSGYEYLTEEQRDLYDMQEETDIFFGGDGWYNCFIDDSIYASSALKPFEDIDYGANNVCDFNFETAWIEGVKGYGIGESITCRFSYMRESEYGVSMTPDQAITHVIIFNGYLKSYRAWRNNSRVKQLKLYINGKPYALLNLKDTIALQRFDIGEHSSETDLYLKFEITDVYKGDKYDDTAISELEFDGTGCLCFAKGTMISTPNGAKPIEKLSVGDTVLTLNTQTNEIEHATVSELRNRKHFVYELDFGEVKIEATGDHPFYFDGEYYSIVQNNAYDIITHAFSIGQHINFLDGKKIRNITLKGIKKLDRYKTTYTITKLSKNSLFFANGLCVAVEKIENLYK